MKRRDDRHLESRKELGDIAAGMTAKYSVFMLKANDIEAGFVQELGRLNIFVNVVVLNFQSNGLRIVIGAAGSVIATTPVSRSGRASKPHDGGHG